MTEAQKPAAPTGEREALHEVALRINRLILMSAAKARQTADDPPEDRITDADIDRAEAELLAHIRAAVSAPVAAPARHLEELIGRYWDLAYAEGKEGREHDTKDGAARQCWGEIQQAIGALSAAPADSAMEVLRELHEAIEEVKIASTALEGRKAWARVDAASERARALTRQGDAA